LAEKEEEPILTKTNPSRFYERKCSGLKKELSR
jgi:hypothetical protein